MRLVTHDPDVERLLVEQDPDVGSLRRLATFERLTLRQWTDWRRPVPVGFIEVSVDVDRPGRPVRNCYVRASAAVGLLGRRWKRCKACDRDHQGCDADA